MKGACLRASLLYLYNNGQSSCPPSYRPSRPRSLNSLLFNPFGSLAAPTLIVQVMPSTSDSPAPGTGNTLLQRMINSDIPKTHFFRLLTIPHIAQPDLSSAITSQADEDAMEMYPQRFAREESQVPPNPLASPVWQPSGAWKWIAGMGIRACKNVVTLACRSIEHDGPCLCGTRLTCVFA